MGVKRRYAFYPDLGPLPRQRVEEDYDAQGTVTMRHQVDYWIGDLEMFREPVRVPTRWRSSRVHPNRFGNPTNDGFYHLIPLADIQLGAEWFHDPTQRWPRSVWVDKP